MLTKDNVTIGIEWRFGPMHCVYIQSDAKKVQKIGEQSKHRQIINSSDH